MHEWTFLTNYRLTSCWRWPEPERRMRQIADDVGITERAAHRIVNELVAAGYVSKRRVGRCNSYDIHPEVPLHHPLEREHSVGKLPELLAEGKGGRGERGGDIRR